MFYILLYLQLTCMFHEIVCYVLLFLSCCLDFILVFAISVCSSAYFLNREKDRGGEKEVKREKNREREK